MNLELAPLQFYAIIWCTFITYLGGCCFHLHSYYNRRPGLNYMTYFYLPELEPRFSFVFLEVKIPIGLLVPSKIVIPLSFVLGRQSLFDSPFLLYCLICFLLDPTPFKFMLLSKCCFVSKPFSWPLELLKLLL